MGKLNTNIAGYNLQETGEWVDTKLHEIDDKATKSSVNSLKNNIESVKSDISELKRAYKAGGTISTIADLPALDSEHLGYVYNVETAFTTTSDFLEGEGKECDAGTEVGIVDIGTNDAPLYKYNIVGSFVDLSNYYTKDNIDGELYDVRTDILAIGIDIGDIKSDLGAIQDGLNNLSDNVNDIEDGNTTITPTLGNNTTYGDIALGIHSLTLSNNTYGFVSLLAMAKTLANLKNAFVYDDDSSEWHFKGDVLNFGDGNGEIWLADEYALRLNPSLYNGYTSLARLADAVKTPDSAMSDTSTNAVQNKVVKQAIDNVQTSLNGAQSSVANITSQLNTYKKSKIIYNYGLYDPETKTVTGNEPLPTALNVNQIVAFRVYEDCEKVELPTNTPVSVFNLGGMTSGNLTISIDYAFKALSYYITIVDYRDTTATAHVIYEDGVFVDDIGIAALQADIQNIKTDIQAIKTDMTSVISEQLQQQIAEEVKEALLESIKGNIVYAVDADDIDVTETE